MCIRDSTDAVHPGYGFLSENDDFARLCEKNKINFIGPSADSMNLCGDKMRCKEAMLKAKVPTVPGSPDLTKDADDAEKIANDIGYPVMLKSVYGGGGRGIRIVNTDQELRDGYETVTAESIAAVGKSAIIVEKFLEKQDTLNIKCVEISMVMQYISLRENALFKDEIKN